MRVHWPSGREQTIGGIESGTLVTMYENAEQSPSGEAAVRTAYSGSEAAAAEPTTLRIAGVHGEKGLTVYTTMSTFDLLD